MEIEHLFIGYQKKLILMKMSDTVYTLQIDPLLLNHHDRTGLVFCNVLVWLDDSTPSFVAVAIVD